MIDDPAQLEIARLSARVATLEQLIEVYERTAAEQTARLEAARREADQRAEELSRSEEELRRQASIFRLVLDSMADGVAVIDAEGRLVLRNPAAERMLGHAPIAGDGAYRDVLFALDQTTPWPASEAPLARALRGETVDQIELFARPPVDDEPSTVRRTSPASRVSPAELGDDGGPRSVRAPSFFVAKGEPPGVFLTVTATPMRRGDGSVSGAVAVFRDATERKRLIEDLEQKNRDLLESERAKGELVERLRYAIDEISTPILELWDDVLALPVIGVVDSRRSAQIMERLLDEIVRRQSRFVILDVTGVEIVDTRTADHFIKLIKAVELLGARCRISGIRPAVAQTLVDLGLDLTKVRAARNLKHALRESVHLVAQKPRVGPGAQGAAGGGRQAVASSPGEASRLPGAGPGSHPGRRADGPRSASGLVSLTDPSVVARKETFP